MPPLAEFERVESFIVKLQDITRNSAACAKMPK